MCVCVCVCWIDVIVNVIDLLLCVPMFGFYDTELLSYKECTRGVHELL
jgi:hypothetical protein